MKIVIDDKIPYIQEAASLIADEVVYIKGSDIQNDDIRDADALIIRTRTRCDESLLKNSKVKFIATATIGYDHLDTDYLEKAGIQWSNCPGCNAKSVGQYVQASLLLLEKEKGYQLNQLKIGLVGAGHVGTAVQAALSPLGVTVLLNDPPKMQSMAGNKENTTTYCSLQDIMEQCDIISFHTPLIRNGQWPTYHLADKKFFANLKQRPVIINTSRGEVVDNTALLEAINEGQIREAIIDTWENEPDINLELLKKTYIGTPHIAGYSADGKANASRMAIEAVCNFFKIKVNISINPPSLTSPFKAGYTPTPKEQALSLYNPHRDSELLKQHPEHFEELRGNYPLRRELYDD